MTAGVARDVAMADLPAPIGWFAVAFADEVRRGAVRTVRLAGRELVVWRGADGALGAADPVCPHLGAHMGTGGVSGTDLRCPFHGFTFGPDGRCTGTGSGAAAPAGLRVATRPVVEREGVVLVWHHPGDAAPHFDVPDVDTSGWTPMATHRFELAGHPVATSENSVDLAHLAEVHRYRGVRMLEPFTPDGPRATASYEMDRPLGMPGTDAVPGLRRATMRVRFDVVLHGLGVSVVEASIPRLGVRTRQLVLATPVAPGRIELRLGFRVVHRGRGGPAVRLLERAGARLGMVGFVHDVRQDVPIWDRQRYVPRPALAHGDGPITPYRRWAAPFLTGLTPSDGGSPSDPSA